MLICCAIVNILIDEKPAVFLSSVMPTLLVIGAFPQSRNYQGFSFLNFQYTTLQVRWSFSSTYKNLIVLPSLPTPLTLRVPVNVIYLNTIPYGDC